MVFSFLTKGFWTGLFSRCCRNIPLLEAAFSQFKTMKV